MAKRQRVVLKYNNRKPRSVFKVNGSNISVEISIRISRLLLNANAQLNPAVVRLSTAGIFLSAFQCPIVNCTAHLLNENVLNCIIYLSKIVIRACRSLSAINLKRYVKKIKIKNSRYVCQSVCVARELLISVRFTFKHRFRKSRLNVSVSVGQRLPYTSDPEKNKNITTSNASEWRVFVAKHLLYNMLSSSQSCLQPQWCFTSNRKTYLDHSNRVLNARINVACKVINARSIIENQSEINV